MNNIKKYLKILLRLPSLREGLGMGFREGLGMSIFLLLSISTHSQSFQWIKAGGGDGDATNTGFSNREYVRKIAFDSNNNSYVVTNVINGGNAASTIVIDGHIKNLPGTINSNVSQGLLASWDCNGTYRWSKIITCENQSYIQDVKVDSQDNVFIIGNLGKPATNINTRFDTDLTMPKWTGYNATCTNCYSAYIAKYTNAGTFLWQKNLEPAFRNYQLYGNLAKMISLEIDNANNLQIFVRLQKSPDLISGSYVNNFPGASIANTSLHLLKYNNNGIFMEGHHVDYQPFLFDDNYNKMYRNKQTGNLYIVGVFVPFGLNTSLTAGGNALGNGFYITAYDPVGNYLWKIEDTTDFHNRVPYLDFDSDNNIYLTNQMYCSGSYPPQPASNADSFAGFSFEAGPTTKTDEMPFVVKLSPTGQGIWGSSATKCDGVSGRAATVNGNEVAIASTFDNITWSGESQGTSPYGTAATKIYPGIIRLDKETGEMIAMDRTGDDQSASGEEVLSMAKDNLGNYYMGGQLFTSITVNGTNVISGGGASDFFYIKYGTNNCNCQVPTCKFKATKNTASSNIVNFKYQGQNVYNTVLWNFGDGNTSTAVNPIHTYATAGSYNVCLTATNACDSYNYCKIINTTTLLDSKAFTAANEPNMSIYPNPAENEVSVQFQSKYSNASMELYDLTGRLIDLFSTNNTNGLWTINLSNLTTGVYMVVMKENNVVTMQQKLIKK